MVSLGLCRVGEGADEKWSVSIVLRESMWRSCADLWASEMVL